MSIELPNGKISLTLPEQVGHNAKQISKIFQLLDGLNVQDNVVVLDNISHVLTAQEITVLQQAVAFIVYDGHLYIKSGESGTNAYFDIVFSITPPGTAITFASSRITANLSNGALSIVNSSVSTYSATQIDTQLSLKADKTYVDSTFAPLAGANFTGAITSPSIIEGMTGYTFNKNPNPSYNSYSFKYAGVCKNGNKLTFVIFVEITPTTTSANYEVVGTFGIPANVAAKLYPYTQGGLTNVLDFKPLPCKEVSNINNTFVNEAMMANKGVNTVYFQIRNYTLTLNTPYIIRIEQTFLLSDNLAS